MAEQNKAEVVFSADDDALSNSLRKQVQGNEDWARSFRKVAEAAQEMGRNVNETLEEQEKKIKDLKKELAETKKAAEEVGDGFGGALEKFASLRNLVMGNEIVKVGQEVYEVWNRVSEKFVKSTEEIEKMTLELQTFKMLSDEGRKEFVKEHITPLAESAGVDEGVAAKAYMNAERLGVKEAERDKIVEATLRNARGAGLSPEQMPEFTAQVVKGLRQQGKDLTGAEAQTEAQILSNVASKLTPAALPGALKVGETAATAHLNRAEMLGEYKLLADETSPEQAGQALSQLPAKLLHLSPEFLKKMGKGGEPLQAAIRDQLGKGSLAGALGQTDRALKDAVKSGAMTDEEATEARADLFGGRAFARGGARLMERQGELGSAAGELLDTGSAEKRAAASYDNNATIEQRQKDEERRLNAEKGERIKRNELLRQERWLMLREKYGETGGRFRYYDEQAKEKTLGKADFFGYDKLKELEEDEQLPAWRKDPKNLTGFALGGGKDYGEEAELLRRYRARTAPGTPIAGAPTLQAPPRPSTIAIPGIGEETEIDKAKRAYESEKAKEDRMKAQHLQQLHGKKHMPSAMRKEEKAEEGKVMDLKAHLEELTAALKENTAAKTKNADAKGRAPGNRL